MDIEKVKKEIRAKQSYEPLKKFILNNNQKSVDELSEVIYFFLNKIHDKEDKNTLLLELAKVLVLKGCFQESLEILENLDKDDMDVLNLYINLYNITNKKENAINLFLEYGSKNINANFNISRVYKTLSMFAESLECLEKSKCILKDTDYLFYKMFIYIKSGDFNNSLSCLKELEKRKIDTINGFKILKWTKTILENDHNLESGTYFHNQLHNYSQSKALRHCQYHVQGSKKTDEGYFYKNCINKLFFKAQERIKIIKPSHSTVADRYLINFNDKAVGKVSDIETKLVEVVTLPNTSKILTMYPVTTGIKNFDINSTNDKQKILIDKY